MTVRPQGEPGSRGVRSDPALNALLADWLHSDGDVLIVDEGPGITAETFAITADWVRGLGADDKRIVLFPTRTWGMELAPDERRAWFEHARKYVAPAEDPRPSRIALGLGGIEEFVDLCSGRWREIVPGAANEAVCAGHERRKYLARRSYGHSFVMRYAGLGRWGQEVLARANQLADADCGPTVADYHQGYLTLPSLRSTVIPGPSFPTPC